jgi:hypothetical protein
MTINESQDFDAAGAYLGKLILAHCQLYVVVSRVIAKGLQCIFQSGQFSYGF